MISSSPSSSSSSSSLSWVLDGRTFTEQDGRDECTCRRRLDDDDGNDKLSVPFSWSSCGS